MGKRYCRYGKAVLPILESGLADMESDLADMEKWPCRYGKVALETSEAITATVNRNCKSHRKRTATYSPAMAFQHPIMTLGSVKSSYSREKGNTFYAFIC